MIRLANPHDENDPVYDTYDQFEDAGGVEKMHRRRKGQMPVGAHVSATRGTHRSRGSRRSRPERSTKPFAGVHRRNVKSKRMNHPGQSLAAQV